MKESRYIMSDNKEVNLYVWDNVTNPTAVMQLVHGMAEHGARYERFGSFLNANGIILVLNDLRGHGKTDPDTLGYSEGDMWELNIADQMKLSTDLKIKYKLPLIIMGHSYGSFLTQELLKRNIVADAFILSGSCLMKGIDISAGKMIATHLCKSKGGNYPAKMIFNMSFTAYQKSVKGTGSWLTTDKVESDKYYADKKCGFVCSANFYKSFFSGLKKLYIKHDLNKINKDIPLYIFSGADDPVGKYSKGVKKLYKMYIKLGLKNAVIKLYDGGRHEMLNEIVFEKVYNDILKNVNRMLISIN